MELNPEEFLLGNVLDAIISQGMGLLRDRNLQLLREIPEEIKSLSLYGDRIRLQLVLSDFLLLVVSHASTPDGWVEIKVFPVPGLNQTKDPNVVHIGFRLTHPGEGIPSPIIQDMYDGDDQWTTPEGLGLKLSRKLLIMMNGDVRYVRENGLCYFVIDLELMTTRRQDKITWT